MFRNDYSELAAPEVLTALANAANEQNIGYGRDVHTERASALLSDFFGLNEQAGVHFLAGGTVANMTVLSYLLRPYQAVIACDTAHINVHETGAVEASGHKILTVPNVDGKLTAEGVRKVLSSHVDEHMVEPKAVYISFATETGSVYSCEELYALRDVCKEKNLYLFIDGARLAVGLYAANLSPKIIAEVADVFYAGGTKNGALYGEAVVIKDPALNQAFRYHIKNRGAMLAKGFAVAIQFEALFTNGLYMRLAKNAVQTALLLREKLLALGLEVAPSCTNQQFVTLPKEKARLLMERYGCELWKEGENETVIRFVTSFASKTEDVLEVADFLSQSL